MDENIELMKHVYKISDMGISSTKSLLENLKNKDNKIKELLEDELQTYEYYYNVSEEYLNSLDIIPKKEGLLTKFGSEMGIMMETIKDNSDSAIASMLIEGFTMGEVELEGLVSRYKKKANRDVLSLIKEYENFHKREIEKLKTFI
jgi:hypothetical protein